MRSYQPVAAEFLGTFALVFAAIGSTVSSAPPVSSGLGLLGAALASGLVLAVVVASFGGMSGAHFNPAVTLGMLVVGRIELPMAWRYVAAQLGAGLLAALTCWTIYPVEAVAEANLAVCTPAFWVTTPVLLFAEALMTFLLMIGIYGTVIDERGSQFAVGGGIGLGAIVAANILTGGAVTGAAMNPARAFGPALVQGDFAYHWAYWLAPCAGAVAGALFYEHLLLDDALDDATERADATERDEA